MAMPVLADFAGHWQIDRVIDDRRAGQTGTLTGFAQFTREDRGLWYHETGLLTLGPAAPMAATRDYLWRQDGALIAVDYADGRPFHAFDPATPVACHLCLPDDYQVRYDFGLWPVWSAVWRVSGPRKDYLMTTTYRPADHACT